MSDLLLLEIGNLLEVSPRRGPVVNPFLIERMAAEGVQAIVPGPREFAQWESFRALLANVPIPVTIANVARVTPDGIQPVAPRLLTMTVGGVRIGLLGLLGSAEFQEIEVPPTLRYHFQAPREAIEELVPQLRATAELVVVAACMNDADAVTLAEQLSGVDVLINSYQSICPQGPRRVGEVILNHTGWMGQYAAVTRLIVSPQGELIDWGGRNLKLDASVPLDTTVARRVEEIDAAARAVPQRPQTPEPAPPRFLGAATCGRCHAPIHELWQAGAHARATTTLVETGRHEDAACIGCHVTGPAAASGLGATRPESAAGQLLDGVQCEACHGPGTEHRRGSERPTVGEAVCRRCHTPRWSPEWNYAHARAAIRHWDGS